MPEDGERGAVVRPRGEVRGSEDAGIFDFRIQILD
jgi:hypothetical protein